MNERLCLKPREVAPLLGVSPPVVYALCRRADFPAIHVGRSILIPVNQLQEWLAKQSRTINSNI